MYDEYELHNITFIFTVISSAYRVHIVYIYSVEYELWLWGVHRVWVAFCGFQRLRPDILIEYILRILLVYSVLYSSLEKRRGFFDIDVTMCNDIY